MTLDELIEEGNTFEVKHEAGYIEPAGYGMLKQVSGYFYLPHADKFSAWIQKCRRYLSQNYPKDISIDSFNNLNNEKITQAKIYELVGVLLALKEVPVICESKPFCPASMQTITVNQTQNQAQKQNFEFISQILKEELKGKDYEAIEEILNSAATKDTKKKRILEKLKDFGEDIIAGIVATLLTSMI